MTDTFIKAIDRSLIPATLAIVCKLFVVVLMLHILGIPWSFGLESGSIFSLSSTVPQELISDIVSYSDLVTYLVICGGFSIRLIQALFLRITNIKPALLIKIANKNLLGIIQNSYDVYNKAFVWLIFVWLINIVMLINTLNGITHFWIFTICSISTIVLTATLFNNIYSEFKHVLNNIKKYI